MVFNDDANRELYVTPTAKLLGVMKKKFCGPKALCAGRHCCVERRRPICWHYQRDQAGLRCAADLDRLALPSMQCTSTLITPEGSRRPGRGERRQRGQIEKRSFLTLHTKLQKNLTPKHEGPSHSVNGGGLTLIVAPHGKSRLTRAKKSFDSGETRTHAHKVHWISSPTP